MTDPRKDAPTAGEELEREIREAETAVPEGSRDDHESEAGDALSTNLGAQREASGLEDSDGGSGGSGDSGDSGDSGEEASEDGPERR